jgi:hypothetical protein
MSDDRIKILSLDDAENLRLFLLQVAERATETAAMALRNARVLEQAPISSLERPQAENRSREQLSNGCSEAGLGATIHGNDE